MQEIYIYIGITACTWEEGNHSNKTSFNNKKYSKSTTLSKHVCDLRNTIQVMQNITSQARKTTLIYNDSKQCNFSLKVKIVIIIFIEQCKVDRSSEIISICRHENKFLQLYHDTKDE